MREARLQCHEGLHLINSQSPNVVLHGDRVVNYPCFEDLGKLMSQSSQVFACQKLRGVKYILEKSNSVKSARVGSVEDL